MQSNGTNPVLLVTDAAWRRQEWGNCGDYVPIYARPGILVTDHVGENPGNCNKNRDIQFWAAGCVRCECAAALPSRWNGIPETREGEIGSGTGTEGEPQRRLSGLRGWGNPKTRRRRFPKSPGDLSQDRGKRCGTLRGNGSGVG